jgi:hypothetical protein
LKGLVIGLPSWGFGIKFTLGIQSWGLVMRGNYDLPSNQNILVLL